MLGIVLVTLGLAAPVVTSAPAPLDTMIDVGGHRLHFLVHRGTAPITIVMESGGGADIGDWNGIDSVLAQRTGATVVAYDRAGFGRSELGAPGLLPMLQVEQLEAALQKLNVPERRIILGHSYGGVMAVLYAHRYPEKTAGVVLSDPMNARFVDATGDFVYSTVPNITNPKDDAERAVQRLVRTFKDAIAITRTAEPALRMPMVVLTSGQMYWRTEEALRAWRQSHEAIAAAAPNRRLLIAEKSGHQIHQQQPELVIDAVLSLLR